MTIDFDNPSAFAPFFDRDCATIAWTDAEGHACRGTFAACVIDESRAGDPLAETDVEGLATITVLLSRLGENAWSESTPPRIGDALAVWGRDGYRITSVVATARQYWTLEARRAEKKG